MVLVHGIDVSLAGIACETRMIRASPDDLTWRKGNKLAEGKFQ